MSGPVIGSRYEPLVNAAMRVPILMYHEVVAAEELPALERKLQKDYVMTDAQFARQLSVLDEIGCNVIGLDRLLDALSGRADLPANPAVISFDDGYAGNRNHALPILQRFGFTATFFVVSRKIGDPFMMNWEQLRELHAAGMLVESHTASHPLLSQLGESATRLELEESKRVIEQNVGAAVRFISLPNGDSNHFYPSIAGELGYLAGCGSAIGFNDAASDRFRLKRIPVKRSMSDADFRGYVLGTAATMASAHLRSLAKGALVGVLGKGVYDKLYNQLFGVEDQRKSS